MNAEYTPRTDAEVDDARNMALEFECKNPAPKPGENILVVSAEFARTLEREVYKLEELRRGDFKLAKALAVDAGIAITAPDTQPGTQWEQLHDGVIALRTERNHLRTDVEQWKEDYKRRTAHHLACIGQRDKFQEEVQELTCSLSVRNDEVTGLQGQNNQLRAEVERLKACEEVCGKQERLLLDCELERDQWREMAGQLEYALSDGVQNEAVVREALAAYDKLKGSKT